MGVQDSSRDGSHSGRVNLTPLLEMIAEQIDAVIKAMPADQQARFSWARKLSEDQVRAIRSSGDKLICIAADYGISTAVASRIRTGTAYRWVK
jgi:hypothetical protein